MDVRPAIIGLSILAVSTASATATSAAEITKWATVSGWEILIDPDAGNGCLMQKTLDEGTRVRIGAVPQRDGGFISVANPSWEAVADDTTSTLTFNFDGELFAGDAVAINDGDLHGNYAFFNNPEFVSDISKRRNMIVSDDDKDLATVDLTGTKKAVDAVLKCQKEQNA